MSAPHRHHAGCGCDHSEVMGDEADGDSLLPYIDGDHVICLNEKVTGSGKTVFKPLPDRKDKTVFMESPRGDPALIFRVPFTSAVRMKSICVAAGPDGRSPTTIKLFVNQEDLDFGNADELEPAQTLEVPEDTDANLFHPVKPAKFNGVHTLHVYLSGTHGADDLCVYYIGLKGIDTKARRAVVNAVYESKPTSIDMTLASKEMVGESMKR